tara:strand:+ start:72877 stop:73434 length:558 start_codon:yes stop_codon:yes gene_type:complete
VEEAPSEPIVASFTIESTVVGDVPSEATVAVIWILMKSESLYSFGTGSLTDARYAATLPGAQPPSQAINDLSEFGLGRFAIGFPVLVAEGDWSEGPVEMAKLDLLGLTPNHAIVWREGDFPAQEDGNAEGPQKDFSWPSSFEEGTFQCGECAEGPGHFDIFTPVDCSSVEITVGSPAELKTCNWT